MSPFADNSGEKTMPERPPMPSRPLSMTGPTSSHIVADSAIAPPSQPGGTEIASTSAAENFPSAPVPAPTSCQIDEVMIDALQVPRDRIFILRQEKEMEDRIRNGQEKSWELPLMNSYQRLLVHRIADHFHLAHSIDSVSKAVTLTKQDTTKIPELSLSSMAMAAMERLSEPAYAPPKEGSSSSMTFKIMRREESGRSASPRARLNMEEGASARDRRNMTIEEREAAYKEARLRIFGSEEVNAEESAQSSTNALGEEEVRAIANLSLEAESSTSSSTKSNSRKGTPGRVSPAPSSTSSSSSAAILRAGAPLFDPSSRGNATADAQWLPPQHRQQQQQQQALPYAMFDANGQPIYAYAGGYGPPMLQHDQFGRPIYALNGPVMSPQYPFATPGSSGSAQEIYSSAGPSPSASSRSTSVSNDVEADAGSRNGTSDSLGSQSTGQGRNGSYGSRPSSVSPTSSFIRSGPGAVLGANGTLPGAPLLYQGQGPVPPSWSNFPPAQMAYNSTLGANSHPVRLSTPTLDASSGRGLPRQPAGYAAAVLGQARAGAAPYTPSGTLMQGLASTTMQGIAPFGGGDPLQADRPDARDFGSRGRANQADRSLFDPSKPSNGGTSSTNSSSSGGLSSTARHSLGKSTSAAGMLESKTNGVEQRSQQSSIGSNASGLSADIHRRVSSSSSSSHSPVDSLSRRGTPPSHPSLPARPDWVLQQKSRVSNANGTTTTINPEESPSSSSS